MLCSIIVAVIDNLDYSRIFFDCVKRKADCPYELIVIDNASSDGTQDYVRSLPNSLVIRHDENVGVPKAWNEGIRASKGDYLAICNNDLILPPAWLSPLIRDLEQNPDLGMVFPVEKDSVEHHPHIFGEESAFVLKIPRLIEPKWDSINRFYGGSFDDFAARFYQKHQQVRLFGGMGACMVMRREVVDDIGLFEEGFGLAYAEDYDFWNRIAMNHRYRGIRTHGGVFIHHFAGMSGQAVPEGEFQRAYEKYFAKYPEARPADWRYGGRRP